VECGLFEVRPSPFVADAGELGVRVTNPLAASEALLRSSALQTLARRVEHNFAHMVRNVRLFEVGVVFMQHDGPLPIERTVAAAVIAGDRFPAHFTDGKPPQVDLWDARWIGERIARSAFQDDATELVSNDSGDGWLLRRDGHEIGSIRALAVDAPVWAPVVYGIEVDITSALGASAPPTRYRPLPSFPATEFDLALLLPQNVVAADVERVIAASAGELLESLVPFDEFRGAGMAAGERSVAWRLTLRHPERTLRDKEIEGRRARILRALNEELGVRPRTA
jgi:phenylalanyl-tRNA synthetase beta chain